MNSIFRVAVLQKRSPSRDCEENTASGLLAMEAASKMGADILLFPECFLTGYQFPVSNESALPDCSPFLKSFQEKANALSMGVVVTTFSQGTQRAQNSAYVIDKQGHLLMKYSKVHTCDFSDERCLESGTEFKVCDFHGVKIGIMICYDREYPESARILMLKGAELILVPNDCCSMAPRLCALQTRAYENMVGIAMANPPGNNAGCSCAYSPIPWDENGECLPMEIFVADAGSEGIFLAEYDLNRLRTYRKQEMMGNTFRKTAAYSELLCTERKEPFLR